MTTVPRCLHIYDSGFQCLSEALDATDFCDSHQKVVALESERLEEPPWRKTFLRFVALVLLARRYHMKVLLMLDVASPAAALGYGIGRIGCLISGDGDYGAPTSLPWGMSFPNGLVPTTERVHPTPIYELLAALVIAYFLWRIGPRILRRERPDGTVFACYLMLTAWARFLVEFIRINPKLLLGLTNAQLASVLCFIGGAILLWKLPPGQHTA